MKKSLAILFASILATSSVMGVSAATQKETTNTVNTAKTHAESQAKSPWTETAQSEEDEVVYDGKSDIKYLEQDNSEEGTTDIENMDLPEGLNMTYVDGGQKKSNGSVIITIQDVVYDGKSDIKYLEQDNSEEGTSDIENMDLPEGLGMTYVEGGKQNDDGSVDVERAENKEGLAYGGASTIIKVDPSKVDENGNLTDEAMQEVYDEYGTSDVKVFTAEELKEILPESLKLQYEDGDIIAIINCENTESVHGDGTTILKVDPSKVDEDGNLTDEAMQEVYDEYGSCDVKVFTAEELKEILPESLKLQYEDGDIVVIIDCDTTMAQ